jgi:hypothetical protein
VIGDLIALVADRDQEAALQTLLQERTAALGIRRATFRIHRHPEYDSGVYRQAGGYLASIGASEYERRLIVLDAEWTGAPGNAKKQRDDVCGDLTRRSWPRDSFEVVVIEPALEAWVWTRSPHVPAILGTSWHRIAALGEERGWWYPGAAKPIRPKELFEAVLRERGLKPTSARFGELARRVTLANCRDPAFCLLVDTLRHWFPP